MMRTLFGRLLISHVTIILISLVSVGGVLSYLFSEYAFNARQRDLIIKGKELAAVLEASLPSEWSWPYPEQNPYVTKTLMRVLNRVMDAQVWLVDTSGLVAIAEQGDPNAQPLHLSKQDLQSILAGEVVVERKTHPTSGGPALTVLVPIIKGGQVLGAIFIHSTLRGVLNAVAAMRSLLLYAMIAASGAAAIAAWMLAHRISYPLKQMTGIARNMAQHDFHQRVVSAGPVEVDELASAINHLSSELGSTIEALARSKSQTESILASMSEGVVAVDREGKPLFANAPISRLLSLHIPQGGNAQGLEPIAPLLRETMLKAAPQTTELHSRDHVLRVYASPIRGADQAVQGAVALLQDVSDHWRLEQMRREFVANVSHELRTPLTSIRGFLQAMVDGIVTEKAAVEKYLRVMLAESLRLIRLANGLLDVSRLDSGAVKLHLQPLAVADVVSEVLEAMEPAAQEKNIQIKPHVPPELPMLAADRDRLCQIFINLLDNAIRFTPDGGLIQVVACSEGDFVAVSVKDSGTGISPEELPKIWERFYKVDKSRQNQGGGTGLGLVIVRQLVELHGGEAWAESTLGMGTTIWFRIPVARQAAATAS